jgi:hypothetical protein
MALQSITNINVDFYDKKHILINAKQNDKKSRFLSVACYNHGEPYSINAREHSAYIRYKKSDNHSVFNFCDIDNYGKIIVELTEQMLASDGISCADLVIVYKGSANIDSDTGEIVTIDDASILSTMSIYIDVSESVVANSDIESSYEFNGLNTALEKAEAEYTEVIQLSKSYAVGNAGGIRENEDYDNSKYYYEQALNNANNASQSEANALASANKASASERNALTSANSASISASNALTSETNAYGSASSASSSETAAKGYAATAQSSMNSAVDSASSASESALIAQNYYLQTEAITNGLNGAFLPMGTVEYAELVTMVENGTVAAGYLYHITDNFISDDSFKVGAGVEYTAGTNVYYTADGYWDCLVGTTVTGVKGSNETIYRKGNVNLTAENVGAISIMDIATVDEVKNYLGI